MSGVQRFAGYASPQALLADPSLSEDEKLGGLRTWRGRILRLGRAEEDGELRRLLGEIDRAFARLGSFGSG
ncbi:hypothetical protein [uncultured Amaricoccus sp.]|uniref:hypothetical protein n=1 Tax=uncultured Amaricoccus sp. TaxID=339341 RepID=UPI00260711E3|nr:hypothetical protein [uncultured Amaricoccus sp.]